jgi:hypothetical protein
MDGKAALKHIVFVLAVPPLCGSMECVRRLGAGSLTSFGNEMGKTAGKIAGWVGG